MPRVTGYNIYSDQFPKHDILEIKTGYRYPNFDKQIIFSPKIDINFNFGCHYNKAKGHIVRGGDLKLLHYRCIGGLQRMIDRHKMYSKRMCAYNLQKGLGIHYLRTPEQLAKEWQLNMNRAKKLLFLNNQ